MSIPQACTGKMQAPRGRSSEVQELGDRDGRPATHPSSSERPCHHQRELFSPECAAMRPGSLIHDDIRTGVAQGVRPPSGVLEEERLLPAGDEVCARKWTRHDAGWPITAARRGAKDRTVDMWIPKP